MAKSNFYQLIQPEGIYQPATYNHAMRAGNTLYVAGQVARDSNGALVAPFDAAAQAKQVYHNLGVVLEAAGSQGKAWLKSPRTWWIRRTRGRFQTLGSSFLVRIAHRTRG
jgi:enamine deaminase RidA (YjgF/YER057c/UK114 family)